MGAETPGKMKGGKVGGITPADGGWFVGFAKQRKVR